MAQELRRTLEEVGAERDKLGTLFLHMTDGVASFGRDGAPIQMNPAAERLLGRSFDKIGSYGEALGAVAPLADVMALREPRYLQKDWETGGRSLLVSLAPFGGEPAEGVMAVLHDVTHQRQLEDLRREFVSNVSHELRTPLTNIRSYAETLHDTEDLPPDRARSFSQVILSEAERMNRVVRDLLTLSRFDYGKMDWHVALFPLGDMLKSIHDAMLLEAGRQGHTLTLDGGAEPIVLSGDRERLEQVAANILSNAIKYTPPGGRIALTARREGDNAVFTVADNGIGIPEEDMPRLFERFYRVDKARSRRLGGTGLGLAIAREIVEKHRGDIKIESRLGQGTTVKVILPMGDNP
jgi:two-component system sensor histidine kinase VicK